MKHTLPIGIGRPKRGGLDTSVFAVNRRAALQLLASGAAMALTSCGHPEEEVVPYVNLPDDMIPGTRMAFATSLSLSGYGRGVIVSSVEGRPIKVDGNPKHPASLGATDIFNEAEVLSLYDPDRSKTPRAGNSLRDWSSFEAALLAALAREQDARGAGLRILTTRITSPTLIGQINETLKRFPQARWYRYEPVDDDAALAGSALAYGRPLLALPRLHEARVILALDADPLGPGPAQIRFAREFIGARNATSPQDFPRLYAAEPALTLTGANADHQLPIDFALIRNVALTVAAAVGVSAAPAPLPTSAQRFAEAAAADLKARSGQAIVLAGQRQSADVHALCHFMNQALRAPVDFIEPVDPITAGHLQSLRDLTNEISANKVHTLLVLGGNPAFDAPAALRFGDAIASIPFSAHLSLYDNETSARCSWHLPLSHLLESWSDLRAFDGTAGVVQPLIRPLYATRTAHDLLAFLGGPTSPSSYELVRTTWRKQAGDSPFETWWRQTLQDGVVANSAAKPVDPGQAKLPDIPPAKSGNTITLVLAPDASIWDGSAANNAWLQECPKPLTKQVWGNVLHVSDGLARRFSLVDGSVVRLRCAQGTLEAPVLIRTGQADNIIETSIGYGRTFAGAIANGIGFDVAPLRSATAPWVVENIELTPTDKNQNLLLTQHHFALEGDARELQPRLVLSDLMHGGGADLPKPGAEPPTLYPPPHYDTYQWAMVIDTAACIGCNACVVACQSENNVPIVGPDEIAAGRDMHWLRIDNYFVDERPGFSPIPCMHCEHAPCEPVCPVAASIHDSEGLNVQVYNRCVGTRFCESNCPYKVRRFNFYGYADGQEYASFGADSIKAVFNPDVTVRARGVMEKCTYCIQRISAARRTAEKQKRRIHEGEVVTACQAACPTRAIQFGDLADPTSPLHALRRDPRSYALLGDLGTRPRTTYLARLTNPNDALAERQS